MAKYKFYGACADRIFQKVFGDENDTEALEWLLYVTLNRKVKVLSVKAQERVVESMKLKMDVLDIIAEADGELISIEMNNSCPSYLHKRNAGYIFHKYAKEILKDKLDEKKLNDIKNYTQINITRGLSKDFKAIEIYELVNIETGHKFIDNLKIYEINLDKLESLYYNESRDKYLIFETLNVTSKEELHKICVGNKLLEKIEKKVVDMNMDPDFVKFMTAEEEDNYVRKNVYNEGKESGIKIGEANGIKIGEVLGKADEKKKIAKNLLDMNLDIDAIVKATGLSALEIKNLK